MKSMPYNQVSKPDLGESPKEMFISMWENLEALQESDCQQSYKQVEQEHFDILVASFEQEIK